MLLRVSGYICWLGVLSLLSPACGQTLPDGAGKELVEQICSSCHGVEVVAGARMSKERWVGAVDDMIARGATGTDEEIKRLLAYLANNLAPRPSPANIDTINVNKATAQEFSTVLGFSLEEGRTIVNYRQQNGNFKTLSDLAKVPGISPGKLEEGKNRIVFD